MFSSRVYSSLRHPCIYKVLSRRLASSPCSETASVSTNPQHLVCLSHHRSLILLRGSDTNTFLQGLVPVDMTLLATARALYSMLLNAQGRVLYDVLLYQHGEGDVLMECDSRVSLDIIKHLKRYALRSKVEVAIADEEYRLWGLFPGGESLALDSTTCYPDPRVNSFSTRLISKSGVKVTDFSTNITESTTDAYHRYQIQSGIAEGIDELAVGNCLPLEYNLDYLNGVSFNKGCYLGQELTARSHHTGVIRKRVMPITLSENVEIAPRTSVQSSSGKSAGKLICQHGGVGLALLRLQELSKELSVQTAMNENVSLTAHQPPWWP